MAVQLQTSERYSDLQRRRLLDESDRLLERIEQLRLAGQRELPPQLAQALLDLQVQLGPAPSLRHNTLHAAHNAVFALQQGLVSANRRNPTPRAHAGRRPGEPRVIRVTASASWKVLVLPARRPDAEQEWPELVEVTVERAYDRWRLAQARAVAAARGGDILAGARLAQAEAAWSNFWELRQEAEKLLGRELLAGPA
ncbi:MAG: hypothetical protein M3072_10200 [Candidatus Dormibacteraeota bacterium]|nr:hypothetical protein [Candidatus Dormibacteraeota bacterium]